MISSHWERLGKLSKEDVKVFEKRNIEESSMDCTFGTSHALSLIIIIYNYMMHFRSSLSLVIILFFTLIIIFNIIYYKII